PAPPTPPVPPCPPAEGALPPEAVAPPFPDEPPPPVDGEPALPPDPLPSFGGASSSLHATRTAEVASKNTSRFFICSAYGGACATVTVGKKNSSRAFEIETDRCTALRARPVRASPRLPDCVTLVRGGRLSLRFGSNSLARRIPSSA